MAKAISMLFAAAALVGAGATGCGGGECGAIDEEVGMLQVKTVGGTELKPEVLRQLQAGKKFDAENCPKSTGGSCSWLSCDSSRNSRCVDGQCVCGAGLCAVKGMCVEPPAPSYEACAVNTKVECPGSPGSFCKGDQCCPATQASGGKTFPCPSAYEAFADCETDVKVLDCTDSGVLLQAEAKKEQAKGSCHKKTGGSCNVLNCDTSRNAKCVNGECVCGAGFCARHGQCIAEVAEDEEVVVEREEEAEPVEVTCMEGSNVQCPGSGGYCQGDQCCPGTDKSGGKTFPCPSAAAAFTGCESHIKVEDCLE